MGLRLIEVSPDRTVATLAFAEPLQQLIGVFHAAALMTLADTTAPYACMYEPTQNSQCSRHRQQ
ncbi:hypothetical protein NKDENANG_01046 [Candidatus Entotheonellaceae bacterium PAL068K]